MASFQIEFRCPKHGLERFNIKIIKKYNVSPEAIAGKFRTRPKYELSGVIVGRKVSYSETEDFLLGYFKETGMIDKITALRLIP